MAGHELDFPQAIAPGIITGCLDQALGASDRAPGA